MRLCRNCYGNYVICLKFGLSFGPYEAPILHITEVFGLAAANIMYIIIVTYILLFERDFNYVRSQKRYGFQAGNLEKAGYPQSAPVLCQRRIIYEPRLFRFPRSGTSQIRNDTSGMQGWMVSRSGCSHIWFFPCGVLSSQGGFRKIRIAGTTSLASGPQKAPQIIARDSSVYQRISGRQNGAGFKGTIAGDPAKFRNFNSSTNHRTYSCTDEKKMQVDPALSQGQLPPCHHEAFTKSYEKLREQVLGTPVFDDRGPGLASFAYQGMTTWMQKCSTYTAQEQSNTPLRLTGQISSPTNPPLTSQIVSMLTNMLILSNSKEISHGCTNESKSNDRTLETQCLPLCPSVYSETGTGTSGEYQTAICS